MEERSLIVEVKILALRKGQTLKDFVLESLREKFQREAPQFTRQPILEHVKTGEQRGVLPTEVAEYLQTGEWRSVDATPPRRAGAKERQKESA
jgi:hypothetical protein